MLRKTLVSIAVSSALFVSSSYALELGELTSQSKMDEPYRGKIVLSDVGALTQNDILIRLGSESEFRQAGFPPTRVLSQLKFSVVRENGELMVNVSSDTPLNVEELRFILAARWPSGQMVREYTSPLEQSALVEKTSSDIVQSSSMMKDTGASGSVLRDSIMSNDTMSKAAMSADKMAVKESHQVRRGNTLWSIADQNRPSNALTIYQTMIAIQALNKDAFYSNNINLLKEGVILRLPSQDQIEQFNQATSKADFLRQHAEWMALKGKNGGSVDRAQLNTQAKSNEAPSNGGSSDDKLMLSSGQSLLSEGSGSSNAGDGDAAKLQMDLSASQEMLDKEKREKEELSEKLGELNEQLETLEQLISLKDAQMAELQQQFTSAVQALQEQKNTVDQLLEADELRREKEQAEADSLVNKIFGNPIIVSVGAVVLLLLGFLIGLIMRRSGKKKDDEDVSTNQDEFDLSASAPVAADATSQVETDDFDLDESNADEIDDFDSDIMSDDENADDMAFAEDDFDSDFDDVELEEDELAEDDLPDPVLDIAEDDIEDFSEDEIPTMMAEVEDELIDEPLDEVDSAIDDAIAEIDDVIESADEADLAELALDEALDEEVLEEELEALAEPEEAVESEEIDPFEEPESTEDLEVDLGGEDDLITSEEESFVSSLLDDPDQDDADESDMFNGVPDDTVENTIEEALAELQEEEEVETPEFGEAEAAEDEEESDEEEEFDFFDASGDEIATKLDLARAYMDMGDEEGARVILEDVVEAGNEAQIAEAKSMMERLFPSD